MMIVPPEKYNEGGNRSNNGEYTYMPCKPSACGVQHDKLYRDEQDLVLNTYSSLTSTNTATRDEHIQHETNVENECHVHGQIMTYDADDSDDDIEIILYSDKTAKGLHVAIVPAETVGRFENEQNGVTILATSKTQDMSNSPIGSIKDTPCALTQSVPGGDNGRTYSQQATPGGKVPHTSTEACKSTNKTTSVSSANQLYDSNATCNWETPKVKGRERHMKGSEGSSDDFRTPKRVQFQSDSRSRTPRTISKAHKIVAERPNKRNGYTRCNQSKSCDSVTSREGSTASRYRFNGSSRNGVYRATSGYKCQYKISPSTENADRLSSSVCVQDKHSKTPEMKNSLTARSYKPMKNEPFPRKTKSCSTQSASYSQPEKKMVIVKKGQDIASVVAEQENIENQAKQKLLEEVNSRPTITTLKPVRQDIAASELKQMISSVQMSKSRSCIKPDGSNSDQVMDIANNYRNKSTVTVSGTGVEMEKATKTKLKQQKKKKKSPKKKQPKTQIEMYQRMIETGHLRSRVSRYKTESLRGIRLLEKIHDGTFSVKYKASYQNKQIVMSLFKDQDVSDIDDFGMAQLGNCYFILGINDCISGPNSTLWFISIHQNLGDLQKLLARDSKRHVIGERHAQFITAGVLLAVDYLHRRDIVHGNIKPSKVLINNGGFPLLTGYLKTHETPDDDQRDVYTPSYAAPERYRGNRARPVDIFSSGCLAYEIVTGSTPFDGETLEQTKSNILKSDVRPLYEPHLFSLAGEYFIDACLCKNAKERFEIGDERINLLNEEWFCTLDWLELRKQTVVSPILEALEQLANGAVLNSEEKSVLYDWGRIMDTVCPDRPGLEPDIWSGEDDCDIVER